MRNRINRIRGTRTAFPVPLLTHDQQFRGMILMINDVFPQPIVAAVQAAPAYLDRDAGIKKVRAITAQAKANGADLVVFSESFIPDFPLGYICLRQWINMNFLRRWCKTQSRFRVLHFVSYSRIMKTIRRQPPALPGTGKSSTSTQKTDIVLRDIFRRRWAQAVKFSLWT